MTIWANIECCTTTSLRKIKTDFSDTGPDFDEKFRENFLHITNNPYGSKGVQIVGRSDYTHSFQHRINCVFILLEILRTSYVWRLTFHSIASVWNMR